MSTVVHTKTSLKGMCWETVALLREIDGQDPHRAHLEILSSLHINNRMEWINKTNNQLNFDGMLLAWIEVLDSKELNKLFFKDLFVWFRRATTESSAKFPKEGNKIISPEQHVIRLIARLLFVWFLKEKSLIQDELFIEERFQHLLKNYDSQNGDSWYRAILQNLFFATLNTEIKNRRFRSTQNAAHGSLNCYQYKEEMADPDKILALFRETPFINGGLFECLDSEETGCGDGYIIDCFSDNEKHKKLLSFPNRLFFDELGLIPILRKYKFTLEENTPLVKEVALDPELLGKVFENLLATQKTETQETARRKQGSYYTPRTIVDYMVNESIKSYLCADVPSNEMDSFSKKISCLLNYEYNFSESDFSDEEKKSLVTAIAMIKIIDPAVGFWCVSHEHTAQIDSRAVPFGSQKQALERCSENPCDGEGKYGFS